METSPNAAAADGYTPTTLPNPWPTTTKLPTRATLSIQRAQPQDRGNRSRSDHRSDQRKRLGVSHNDLQLRRNGNLISTTDPLGNVTVNAYDNLNREVAEDTHGLVNWFKLDDQPSGTSVTFQYLGHGFVESIKANAIGVEWGQRQRPPSHPAGQARPLCNSMVHLPET